MTDLTIDAMPAFAVFHKEAFLGLVSAVSIKQARKRAAAKFPGKRLAVELALNCPKRAAQDEVIANLTYQTKRSPYATPGFAERRAAAIAEWEATR